MKKTCIITSIVGILLAIVAIKACRTKEIQKKQWFICFWATLWKSELLPSDKIVKVKTWRSAIIDSSDGCRRYTTLIPEWMFWDPMWKYITPEKPFWKKINRALYKKFKV